MKFISLVFILVTSFSFAQNGKSEVLTQKEFKEQISSKKVQLIDVRTPEEYNNGYIKNAKNINYNSAEFKKEVEKLDKTKAVYVYCQAGGRSASAAKVLIQMGFTKVFDLKGGYGKWVD
jgi:rhodanese-related sulfurtransferase